MDFIEIISSSIGGGLALVITFLHSLTIGEALQLAWTGLTAGSSGYILAFALVGPPEGHINEALLSYIKQWHGSIHQQFLHIENIILAIKTHPDWPYPAEVFAQLLLYYNELKELIPRCEGIDSSPRDRDRRDLLLEKAVSLCLLHVKIWSFGMFSAGTFSEDQVHALGFLVPGEQSRHHDLSGPINMTPEVKVKVQSAEVIRVVADQSAGENAADVVHGWPRGVKHVLIIILSAEDNKEIYRSITSKMHNDIVMPEGSRGKQFTVKAAFLKHTDDVPRFGNEPLFSMPLTTEDLVARQHQQVLDDLDEQLLHVRRHREEIERLEEEMRKRKEEEDKKKGQ
jgi:hypothetical protein